MHFYFDFIHNDSFEFPGNWEALTTESIGSLFLKSRIDTIITNDQEAMTATNELIGKFGACSLDMAQIKEACSVNDADEMKIIPPIHREKIFQIAIQGDWQFE